MIIECSSLLCLVDHIYFYAISSPYLVHHIDPFISEHCIYMLIARRICTVVVMFGQSLGRTFYGIPGIKHDKQI